MTYDANSNVIIVLQSDLLIISFLPQLTGWLSELRQELRSEEVADTLEGSERLILTQVAEKDMKVKLDSQTIFSGKDDMMCMTITVFTDGSPIVGTKKYVRHHIHGSHTSSGTCSPNGTHSVNGRTSTANGFLNPKADKDRKLSAPF